MKKLGIIGVVLGTIGLIIGLYCQLEIVPLSDRNVSASPELWRYYHDQKFLLGSIALFVGILSIVLGGISGIKKQKVGWLSVIVGLISFLLGASQSTHLFS